jgi:DNA damage-binding protein 1
MTLQSNLAQFVKGPGDVDFLKYRAFKNQVREADEPYRLVDGDLIEQFLDETEDIQEKAVEGLGVDVDSVKIIVEALRRLH